MNDDDEDGESYPDIILDEAAKVLGDLIADSKKPAQYPNGGIVIQLHYVST